MSEAGRTASGEGEGRPRLRRAIQTMMDTFAELGLCIGPSLNDEVFVKPMHEPTDAELVEWEAKVTAALKERMGFALRVRFRKY